MSWGGKREGAGRRTKAETLGLAKTLEECVSPAEEKEIWKAIKREALKGNIQHAQLYLNYKYGKPTEHLINEQDSEMIVRIIRNGTDSKSENPPPQSGEGNPEPEAV